MAKINGQLERAQLELLTGLSGTVAVAGRVYADKTDPANVVPRVNTGSKDLPFRLGQTDPLVTTNSGKAVTIDWSTGLNQMVLLTDNCIISFTNPRAGEIHTLVVRQAPTTTGLSAEPMYMHKFAMGDQAARDSYQPVGILSPGEATTYAWFYRASVELPFTLYMSGPRYSPTVLPATLATGIDISPDGKTIAMGRTSSPFASYYDLFATPAVQQHPYGVSAVTPAAAAAQVKNVVFTPDNRLVLYASGTTPFIQGFYRDRGVGVGAALANPATLPTGAANCIAMHPSGLFVGVGHATTPFMSVYQVMDNVAGIGAKVADPVSLPAAAITAMAFSPVGEFLAVASQTTPFLEVYEFVGTSIATGNFGNKLANPISVPAGGPAGSLGKGVAWRPQGDFIALAMATTPFLYVVPFDRINKVFGTPLTIAAQPGACTSVAWSPDGQFLFVGCSAGQFLLCYDFSANTIGSTITFAGTSPGGQVNDIVVDALGRFVHVAINTSPFVAAYPVPTKTRNYLQLLL